MCVQQAHMGGGAVQIHIQCCSCYSENTACCSCYSENTAHRGERNEDSPREYQIYPPALDSYVYDMYSRYNNRDCVPTYHGCVKHGDYEASSAGRAEVCHAAPHAVLVLGAALHHVAGVRVVAKHIC